MIWLAFGTIILLAFGSTKRSAFRWIVRGGGLVLLAWFAVSPLPRTIWGADLYLEITKSETARVPIAIQPFQGPRELGPQLASLEAVFRHDLVRSNLFQILDPLPSPAGQATARPVPDVIRRAAAAGVEGLLWGELRRASPDLRFEAYIFDTSSGETLFERAYIGKKEYEEVHLRSMAHRYADETVFRFTGERGIAQTRTAFVSDQTGNKELFVMDYDGYGPRRLTNDRSIVLSPRWSPDGKTIAFTSYQEGNPDLFLLDITSGRRRKLAGGKGLHITPAWSPDGKRIAYASSQQGDSEIYLVEVEPKASNIVEPKASNKTEEQTPPRRLTFSLGEDLSPTWSPTGQQIAFTSDRGGSPQLYLMNSDGTGVTRLTFEGDYNTGPAWSPRGDWIAYNCRVEGRLKLCIIRPDGQAVYRLTDGPWDDESPSWAPDGRHLAFSSNREGARYIYIMNSDGSNGERISAAPGGHTAPAWSPLVG